MTWPTESLPSALIIRLALELNIGLMSVLRGDTSASVSLSSICAVPGELFAVLTKLPAADSSQSWREDA